MVTHARPVLRLGTRGSALARWQAERVRELLHGRGVKADLVIVRTFGDEGGGPPDVPRDPTVAVKRLFTKEIEDALLARRIDLAVHSLKDLAAVQPDRLVLAACPERADPRDVLVSRDGRGLFDLREAARVGTSSVRRRAALLAARPDLVVVPMRGNVPTRLHKLETDELDGVVLAAAGLTRLGVAVPWAALEPDVVTPAPGQGALAVQCRDDDPDTLLHARPLDDPAVGAQIRAERAALARLEGGCQAPIGALCRTEGSGLVLDVRVYALDGSRVLHARVTVDPGDPEAAGRDAADRLLADGAGELIGAARAGGANG